MTLVILPLAHIDITLLRTKDTEPCPLVIRPLALISVTIHHAQHTLAVTHTQVPLTLIRVTSIYIEGGSLLLLQTIMKISLIHAAICPLVDAISFEFPVLQRALIYIAVGIFMHHVVFVLGLLDLLGRHVCHHVLCRKRSSQ